MFEEIIQSIWFFLPAAFANMAPVLFKWVPFLNFPIWEKYLGAHKTYRGFFFGISAAILVAFLQRYVPFPYLYVDYSTTNVFLLGLLMGIGALIGDSGESFFKRKKGIKPGDSWPIFDQIDWVLGALFATALYVELTALLCLVVLVVFGLLHVVSNKVRIFLKL